MTNPLEIYKQQIAKHSTELKKLEKLSRLFSWLRLLTMASFFVCLWLIWASGAIILLPAAVLFIVSFFFILTKHLNNNDAIENLKRLIGISETEIKVLNHHFTDLPDGSDFTDKSENHEYANDLDIFGRASVFQYINRCSSEQ